MMHVRRYFIAAEPVTWNYAPLGRDGVGQWSTPLPWGNDAEYEKCHYVQYTDDTFNTPVKQPRWLGLLGPLIRGVVGDTLLITFLNRTDHPLSLHPHGVRYDKDSEGAYYFPNPGSGSMVTPSKKFTYVWHVDKDAGPGPGDPSSKVWLYHSHAVMADSEINEGLVGAIIITDRAHARPDGSPNDVDREFVTLFLIFDETGGLNKCGSEAAEESSVLQRKCAEFSKLSPADQAEVLEGRLKHTINGYMFGNVPGLEMNQGERVRWYVLALGSEQDLHIAHWHGKTVLEDRRRRTDDVELMPGSMKVADMNADNPGKWMFHCHVADHMMAGMYAIYTIYPKSIMLSQRGQRGQRGQPALGQVATQPSIEQKITPKTTSDPFPITLRQADNFGEFHMITNMVISKSGRFNVGTTTENHAAQRGNCGTVAVWLLDQAGRVLDRKGGYRSCVEGKKVQNADQSVKHVDWNFSVPADILEKIAGIAIMHREGSANRLELNRANAERARQLSQACLDCIKAKAVATP